MTKAFIVKLNTGSDTDFVGIAEDIKDTLAGEGMLVISVLPWAAPVTSPQSPLLSPPQETTL